MAESSKELLDQTPGKSSVLEALLICNDPQPRNQRGKAAADVVSKGEPLTTPISQSLVMGKVKDFLGVIAKANKQLELDAKEKPRADYDIEALSGNEKEYIEMDLLLGVTDLHTEEAVSAAEAAMNCFQPSRTSYDSSSSDAEEDGDDKNGDTSDNEKPGYLSDNSSSQSSKPLYKGKLKKKPKIIVLDQTSEKGSTENGM